MADHENQRPRLVGIYEHGLDDKGRMVLPAKIRARIGETGMVGMLDGCLGLWSLDRFDGVSERLLALAEAGDAPMNVYRRFMAFAVEVTPDAQGRVVVPQKLRDYAGLGSEVVVTGRGDRAEIWDRTRWTEAFDVGAAADAEGDDDADLSTTFAELRI
jgi:MraZ protein